MGTYRFRRQDSLGLQFTAPYVSMEMVGTVLFSEMNVNIGDIAGVQNIGKNKIVVKFTSTSTFMDVMEKFEDRVIAINNVDSVKVINLSSTITFVSVRNAPFEMDDDVIINILSRYGKVESLRNNRYSVGPFKGLLTGMRTARMKLKDNIPSSISVSGHNLTIIYNGQRRTCYKCGQEGHLVKDCSEDMLKKNDILIDEEFPNLRKNTRESEDSQGDKNQQDKPTSGGIVHEEQTNSMEEDVKEAEPIGEQSNVTHDDVVEDVTPISLPLSQDEGPTFHRIEAEVHVNAKDSHVRAADAKHAEVHVNAEDSHVRAADAKHAEVHVNAKDSHIRAADAKHAEIHVNAKDSHVRAADAKHTEIHVNAKDSHVRAADAKHASIHVENLVSVFDTENRQGMEQSNMCHGGQTSDEEMINDSEDIKVNDCEIWQARLSDTATDGIRLKLRKDISEPSCVLKESMDFSEDDKNSSPVNKRLKRDQ